MRGPLIAGAMLAALFAAPAIAQSVEAGIEAWQRGEHAEAVAIWRPLAKEGDADAAFNLGQAYRLGRGVETNLGAAQTWLERAARKDHLDAQATLGLLLFQNGNLQGGLRWLRMAAEAGEPRALLVYGTALFNGDGVERDPVLAYAYVSRAAAQGLAPAKQTLVEMDRMIPLEQRRKGVALALEKASRPAAESSKPRPRSPAAAAEPAATPNQGKTVAARNPQAAPAPPAARRSATTGGWRVQLGAFSRRTSAEALFERLSGSAPVAGRTRYLVAAGGVTRLQVGPFENASAAAAACKTLAARGQPCFPVAPK